MKIKRDYDRIIDELNAADPGILFSIVRYLYDDLEFEKTFPLFKRSRTNLLCHLILTRHKKIPYKKYLEFIIRKNSKRFSHIAKDIVTKNDAHRVIYESDESGKREPIDRTYCLFFYYISHNTYQGEIYENLKQSSTRTQKWLNRASRFLKITKTKKEHISLSQSLEDTDIENVFSSFFHDKKFDKKITRYDPQLIEKDFHCLYIKSEKVFNNVKRGILFFLKYQFTTLLEMMKKNENFFEMLSHEFSILEDIKDKFENDRMIFNETREKNFHLETKIKSIKHENKKLHEKIFKRIDKSSNKDLVKQNYDLHKEINYLQTRIEKMEEQIAIYEEEKRLNLELADNITIEEKPVTRQKEKPEYMNIVVAGGRWTSDNRKKVCLYLPDNEIEFIEADKILRNYDKIANCDIIFFDTSYNSHAYYYKLKKCSGDFYHINASNLLEFEKIYEG